MKKINKTFVGLFLMALTVAGGVRSFFSTIWLYVVRLQQ